MKKITFTKKDIIDKISVHNGISIDESSVMLKLVLEEIKNILLRQEKNFRIEIRGFGVFEIKPTKPRNNARNPRTNEIIKVPARRKLSFKPGKTIDKQLKKRLK